MERNQMKALNAKARRLARAAAKGNANKARAAERRLKAMRLVAETAEEPSY